MLSRCLFSLLALALFDAAAHAGDSATLPFRETNGLIVLDVRAGERTLAFILDSGAEISLLDCVVAEDLALKRGRTERIAGVTRRTKGYWVRNFAGTLGGIELPGKMLAVNLEALAGRFDRRVDGLIGADFLKNCSVQIDYGRKTVTLGASAAGGTEVPLAVRNGVFCVKARVDGGRSGWLRIDTGCADAVHWSGDVAEAGRDRGKSVAVSRRHTQSQPVTLTLGELRLAHVPAVLRGSAIFHGEAGLLGSGLLRRYVVTIDAPGRRLILR